MANIAIRLGKKIKDARIAADMKQSTLGKHLGVSQAQLSLWETGKRICSTKHLLKLPGILQKKPAYFFEEKEKPICGWCGRGW